MPEQTTELPDSLNRLSERIIGCAIEVHRVLGPGLLERIYEAAMMHEFALQGIAVARQVPVTTIYKGIHLVGQRIDILVEGLVIVELKAVERVPDADVHRALGYARAYPCPLALIINFNVPILVRGVRRLINSHALACVTPTPVPLSAPSA